MISRDYVRFAGRESPLGCHIRYYMVRSVIFECWPPAPVWTMPRRSKYIRILMYDRVRALLLRMHTSVALQCALYACCSLRTRSEKPPGYRKYLCLRWKGKRRNEKRPSIDVHTRDMKKFIKVARKIYKRDLTNRKMWSEEI